MSDDGKCIASCGYDNRTFSLHDALPILEKPMAATARDCIALVQAAARHRRVLQVCHVLRYSRLFSRIKDLLAQGSLGDRKSTRLNSSHVRNSYTVFCMKIKKSGVLQ